MAQSARNFWRFGDPHPKSQLLVAKSQNPKLINGKSQSQIPKLKTRNPKNPKLITRNPKNPNLKLLNPTSQDKAMPPSINNKCLSLFSASDHVLVINTLSDVGRSEGPTVASVYGDAGPEIISLVFKLRNWISNIEVLVDKNQEIHGKKY